MSDDVGGGLMMKSVVRSDVLGGEKTVVRDVRTDGPEQGVYKDDRMKGTFMSSAHVVEETPDQPSEVGGASLQRKIHFFESRVTGPKGLQSGKLAGDYTLGGHRGLKTDCDRKENFRKI